MMTIKFGTSSFFYSAFCAAAIVLIANTSQAGIVGNETTPRLNGSDGAVDVVYSNGYHAPIDGSVSAVTIFDQTSENPFEILQLRPTGTANSYTIIDKSGPLNPTGTNGTVQSYAFDAPFAMLKGDLLAHKGIGLGYTDNQTAVNHNNQAIYYPSTTDPAKFDVNDPLVFKSTDFPINFGFIRDYSWQVDLPGFKETLGYGALNGNAGPNPEGGLMVINAAEPVAIGGQVMNWQFFNDTAETAGRAITPVLFDSNRNVKGIGTTRIGTENGFQQWDFGLVSGTDVTVPGDLFGHYQGIPAGGSVAGTVEYLNLIGGAITPIFTATGGFTLGQSFVGNGDLGAIRQYAINFSIPEPASGTLLMLSGLAALVIRARRRR